MKTPNELPVHWLDDQPGDLLDRANDILSCIGILFAERRPYDTLSLSPTDTDGLVRILEHVQELVACAGAKL